MSRKEGVGHLVTLSEELQPPQPPPDSMKYHLIPIEEFEAPSIEQINEFISICDQAHAESKVSIKCHVFS